MPVYTMPDMPQPTRWLNRNSTLYYSVIHCAFFLDRGSLSVLVCRRKRNRAIGVDLDADVQQWAREHHVAKLGRAEKHVTLLNQNVLDLKTESVDITLAMNFSYWLFKDRAVRR